MIDVQNKGVIVRGDLRDFLNPSLIEYLNKLGLSCAKLRTSFAEIGLTKFQITGWVEEA